MDVDMPTEWATEVAQQRDSIDVKVDWWTEFADTSLNNLVTEALQRNLNLSIAAANLNAAAAQAVSAGASLFPQVDLGADAARRKQNFIGLPIPGAGDKVLSTTTSTYGVSLNISWELDIWGRIRAEQSAAVSQFQASQADYIGTQVSIAAQVCKSFFAVVTTQKLLELALATYDNWKTSTDQVNKRYLSGISSSLEYRLSLSNLSLAEASLAATRAQLDITRRQLELLLKRYPSASIITRDDLPEVISEVPAGIPANIIARRPDLLAAERRLASANMRLKSAERALYPRISLTASGGTSTADLKNLINGDFGIWTLAGNLMQPIFQGGRLRANIDFNEAQTQMAVAEYEKAVLNALSEVENALTNEYYLSEREKALKKAAEQSLGARNLAEIQYSRGVSDFLTMLESTRTAFDTESRYINARRERLDARIDLYLALGGGFNAEDSYIFNDEDKPETEAVSAKEE
jgi:NodT family efflux transporter outer membrane factor (OMF) lipoprotein